MKATRVREPPQVSAGDMRNKLQPGAARLEGWADQAGVGTCTPQPAWPQCGLYNAPGVAHPRTLALPPGLLSAQPQAASVPGVGPSVDFTMLLVLLTPGRWPYSQDFCSQRSPRLPVSLGSHDRL